MFGKYRDLKAIVYIDDAIQANDALPSYSWTQFMQLASLQQHKDELANRLNNKQLSDILTVIYLRNHRYPKRGDAGLSKCRSAIAGT